MEAAWCVRLGQPASEFWRSTPRRVSAFFDALEVGERVNDYRFGLLASLIANAHLRKKHAPAFHPSDFFASLERAPQRRGDMTADEMRAVVGAHFGIQA